MKTIYILQKTKGYIIFLLTLLFSGVFSVHAQMEGRTNVTDLLGCIRIEGDYHQNNSYKLDAVVQYLKEYNQDYLILTFEDYTDENRDRIEGTTHEYFTFSLNGEEVIRFGTKVVQDLIGYRNKYFYVSRHASLTRYYDNNKTKHSGQITSKTDVNYVIFDNLYSKTGSYLNKVTMLIGKNSIGIAIDDDSPEGFRFSPIFFGMDSNLGYLNLKSHIGEFTGQNNDADRRYFNTKSHYGSIDDKKVHFWYSFDPSKAANAVTIRAAFDLILRSNDISNAKTANTKAETPQETEEVSIFTDVSLYPNPAQGSFNLDFGLLEKGSVGIEILDLDGRLVYQDKNLEYPEGNHKYTFSNLQSFPSGMYLVRLTSKTYSKTLKLMVK